MRSRLLLPVIQPDITNSPTRLSHSHHLLRLLRLLLLPTIRMCQTTGLALCPPEDSTPEEAPLLQVAICTMVSKKWKL
jgi:hypothetical protein